MLETSTNSMHTVEERKGAILEDLEDPDPEMQAIIRKSLRDQPGHAVNMGRKQLREDASEQIMRAAILLSVAEEARARATRVSSVQ